jgi:hypothetical protein
MKQEARERTAWQKYETMNQNKRIENVRECDEK